MAIWVPVWVVKIAAGRAITYVAAAGIFGAGTVVGKWLNKRKNKKK